MEIEFKRNINDKVYVMKDNKVACGVINGISYGRFISPATYDIVEVEYYSLRFENESDDIKSFGKYTFDNTYSTKAELLKSL